MSFINRQLSDGIAQVINGWCGNVWSGPNLLIVTEGFAGPQHRFVKQIISNNQVREHVGTLSLDDQVDGAAKDVLKPLSDPLANWAKAMHYPRLREKLRKNTIRLRGTYQTDLDGQSRYFKFKYFLRYEARRALVMLLVHYLEENGISSLLWDSRSGSDWLRPAVDEVGIRMGSKVAICEVSQFTPSSPQPPSTYNSNVCVLVGAVHEGRSLKRCLEECGLDRDDGVKKLAVLADPRLSSDNSDNSTGPWGRISLSMPDLGGSCHADYFMAVQIDPAPTWQVEAATILNQVTSFEGATFDEGADDVLLSPESGPWVALWSLLSELGAESEADSGDMGGRRLPVRWFPNLYRLKEPEFIWDAHWLAEVMIRRFCQLLGKVVGTTIKRLLLVVAVPAQRQRSGNRDGDGEQWIIGAFNHRCGVNTVELPRELIYDATRCLDRSNKHLLETDYHASYLVLFDETAVRLETLHGMNRLLQDSVPDVWAAGVVVDLGHADRFLEPTRYFALLDYDHMAEVDASCEVR
jgi:hypothetical protein